VFGVDPFEKLWEKIDPTASEGSATAE